MIQDSINQMLTTAAVASKALQYDDQQKALGQLQQLNAPEGVQMASEQNDPNIAQKMTESQAKIDEHNRLLRASGHFGKQYEKQTIVEGTYAGMSRAEA